MNVFVVFGGLALKVKRTFWRRKKICKTKFSRPDIRMPTLSGFSLFWQPQK